MQAWGSPGDIIKVALTVTAGIGAVVALVVAYRRQRNLEAAEIRLDSAEKREATKLLNDRFDRATDKLGSERVAIRLAGVHAMASLADDWPEGRQTCLDVLCAYIRIPYEPPKPDRRATIDETRMRERQVRHTVMNVIGKHLRRVHPTPWQGCEFDFDGATIDGGDLSAIRLEHGTNLDFKNATFKQGELNMEFSTVCGGSLSFDGARFESGEVNLSFSDVEDGAVSFAKATFSGSHLNLRATSFHGEKVGFENATINSGHIDFTIAAFKSGRVSFMGAIINGGDLDLRSSRFEQGSVLFTKSVFNGGSVTFRGADCNSRGINFWNSNFNGGNVSFEEVLSLPVLRNLPTPAPGLSLPSQ